MSQTDECCEHMKSSSGAGTIAQLVSGSHKIEETNLNPSLIVRDINKVCELSGERKSVSEVIELSVSMVYSGYPDCIDATARVQRIGDCIGDITVVITTTNQMASRYNLFYKIAMYQNGSAMETIDVRLLRLLETKYLTENERKFNELMAKNGIYVYKVPFYWLRMGCTFPLICAQYPDLDIGIVGIQKDGIVGVKMNADVYCITQSDRKQLLNTKGLKMFGWMCTEVKLPEDMSTYEMKFANSGTFKSFIINTNDKIKCITTRINGHTRQHMDNLMIRQLMVSKYGFGAENDDMYYLEFSQNDIMGTHIGENKLKISIVVEFDEPTKVNSFIKLYREEVYHIGDGLIVGCGAD
jgi:hypothetical protein